MKRCQKCNFVSKDDKKCMRPTEKGKNKCQIHREIFNEDCPVCLDTETGGEWLILTCAHKIHKECLKGMNKEECPVCRCPAKNLPKDIKSSIEKNSEQYRDELVEEEREALMQANMDDEGAQEIQYPPQVGVLLAYSFISKLGIPDHLIPNSVIHLDPGSPLPSIHYIFNLFVCKIINMIKEKLVPDAEYYEDDEDSQNDDEEQHNISDDDDLFLEEGPNVIRHIRTIPISGVTANGERQRARVPRDYFNTMSFQLDGLPPLTDDDLQEYMNTFPLFN